ncbi:putative ankyrin repeat protein [Cotonvirus japonicus]|uniref:Ankyrin repeat protein n=1 Tax=Cotonvirus japonicus TaxID=2811091 RepID=A0ABM7NR15_9VIRU|nr:putative ankyrin repeat protein [Cotonvirus japonicus]BCS82602.1 putative ankyrin repeat protein [Cotonvirus japonicus]
MTDNEKFKKIIFFKVTEVILDKYQKYTHHCPENIPFHDGLNVIPESLTSGDNCKEFSFTTPDYIHRSFGFGYNVRQVLLPMTDSDFELQYNFTSGIWKANKIILGPKLPLDKIETFKFLKESGVELIHMIYYAMERKYFNIVNYLINSTNESPEKLIPHNFNYKLILQYATEYHDINPLNFFSNTVFIRNCKSGTNQSNIFLACKHGDIDFVKYFVSLVDCEKYWHYYISGLREAIRFGYNNILEYLISVYPNYYTKLDVHGIINFILIVAIKNDNLETIKILLQSIPDKDYRIKYINNYNGLALSYVCKRNRIDIAKYLIDCGANISVNNNYCLKRAARKGHINMVKLLVDNGADIHARHEYALRWSARNNHLEIFEFLLQKGANINAKNNYVKRYAERFNCVDLLAIIKNINQ